MAILAELKRELRFSREFLQLIQTLKNIAASQYHMLEKEKRRFEEFMQAFTDFFRVVSLAEVDNPLVRGGSDVAGIIVVTSDSGFMGGLNASVMEAAFEEKGSRSDDKIRWIVIGDKGAASFTEKQIPFKYFRGVAQETRYEQALEIRDYIVQEVLERRIGSVAVAYPRPVSFTQQTVEVVRILPCEALFDHAAEIPEEVPQSAKGFLAESRRAVIESSFDDMAFYLASVWVSSRLFEMFEDSKLAEFSARALHLEGSTQKLEKDVKQLRHKCFRAAHELVDKGMRESFSSRKKKKKNAA